MSTISDYHKYSELSFASYSNMTSGVLLQDYIQVFQDSGDGLSLIQSQNFANTYMNHAQELLLRNPNLPAPPSPYSTTKAIIFKSAQEVA